MERLDHVFGYGSLVNRATHRLRPARPARLAGWRRLWVASPRRPVALLSVAPAPGAALEGLLARVADWPALDAREAAYVRQAVRPLAVGSDAALPPAALYTVPAAGGPPPPPRHPILLSYLDTVVAGYLAEFGAGGAERFFATTDGWERPVLDDRAAPRYGRAVAPSATVRALVDAALAARAAAVIRP